MSLYVDIYKKLGEFTLDVKFESKGDIVSLFGLSGSGKSVTLKCIAGIIKPDSGTIIINNKVVFDSKRKINLPPQKRNVGYLPQNYALFPNMTVKENIKTGLRIRAKNNSSGVLNELLLRFSLKNIENLYPYQISGGQQQRVSLARALATSPEILLLDEPFSALDAQLKSQLIYDLIGVLKDFNSDVLYVSHDKEEVFSICDRVCVVDNGLCDRIRNKNDVLSNPIKTIDAVLLGIENILDIRDFKNNFSKTKTDCIIKFKNNNFKSVAFFGEKVKLNDDTCDVVIDSKIQMIIHREKNSIVYFKATGIEPIIKAVVSNEAAVSLSVSDCVMIGLNINDIYFLK